MNKYDKKHLQDLQTIGKRIERIFIEATKEAARIGARIDQIDPERLFSFDDYPSTKKEIDNLLSELASSVDVAIVNGIESAWTLANNKNNELCNTVFGDNVAKLSQDQYRRYYSTNHDAMVAFRERKQKGLNLSDRVWRYTDTFKREIELGLDVGIRNGLSAQEMAADLKQWLKYPDMLFRRVRDEHGNLQLSKRASLFHPGQGVYRSSYMNARRLAATETNIAYRTADHERWQQLDFVVGIRVVLSNNHTCLGRDGKPHPFEDICDQLSAEYGSTNTTGRGCYPKDFKFTGWHPHCRCHAESILKTDEEIAKDNRRILRGEDPISYKESAAYVKDVPEEFEEWVKSNEERMIKAYNNKSFPYFITDNPETLPQSAQKMIPNYKEIVRVNKDRNYKDTRFDIYTGAVKATHVGHNFNKEKGWYEKEVQETGYKFNHSVILENEPQNQFNKRSTEGYWDAMKFEIAAAETNLPNNIRNALKHCAKKPECEVAVIFFPNKYLSSVFDDGLSKFNGLRGTSQYKHFKKIICVHKGRIIKEISQA